MCESKGALTPIQADVLQFIVSPTISGRTIANNKCRSGVVALLSIVLKLKVSILNSAQVPI